MFEKTQSPRANRLPKRILQTTGVVEGYTAYRSVAYYNYMLLLCIMEYDKHFFR